MGRPGIGRLTSGIGILHLFATLPLIARVAGDILAAGIFGGASDSFPPTVSDYPAIVAVFSTLAVTTVSQRKTLGALVEVIFNPVMPRSPSVWLDSVIASAMSQSLTLAEWNHNNVVVNSSDKISMLPMFADMTTHPVSRY